MKKYRTVPRLNGRFSLKLLVCLTQTSQILRSSQDRGGAFIEASTTQRAATQKLHSNLRDLRQLFSGLWFSRWREKNAIDGERKNGRVVLSETLC